MWVRNGMRRDLASAVVVEAADDEGLETADLVNRASAWECDVKRWLASSGSTNSGLGLTRSPQPPRAAIALLSSLGALTCPLCMR